MPTLTIDQKAKAYDLHSSKQKAYHLKRQIIVNLTLAKAKAKGITVTEQEVDVEFQRLAKK